MQITLAFYQLLNFSLARQEPLWLDLGISRDLGRMEDEISQSIIFEKWFSCKLWRVGEGAGVEEKSSRFSRDPILMRKICANPLRLSTVLSHHVHRNWIEKSEAGRHWVPARYWISDFDLEFWFWILKFQVVWAWNQSEYWKFCML